MRVYTMSTHHLHGCNNYESATALYDRAKPWRGKRVYGQERKLNPNSSRNNCGVTFNTMTKAVHFRLYSTDVITWFPDNLIRIEPYESVTTQRFARLFMPASMNVTMTGDFAHLVHSRGPMGDVRTYRVNSSGATFALDPASGHWAPTNRDRIHPFKFVSVNREKAREVSRRYNLVGFRSYLRAALIIGAHSIATPSPVEGEPAYFPLARMLGEGLYARERVIEALRRSENWPAFLSSWNMQPSASKVGRERRREHFRRIMDVVKAALYIHEKVTEETKVDWLPGIDAIRRAEARATFYRYA